MSELRKDPVVDRWVIIANERSNRPMLTHQGQSPTETNHVLSAPAGRGTPHLKFLPIAMLDSGAIHPVGESGSYLISIRLWTVWETSLYQPIRPYVLWAESVLTK